MILKKLKKYALISSLAICLTPLTLMPSIAQDTQYAQGLILDYYIVQNPEDVQGPKGRSMATLVDTTVPQMTYLSPFEIEPALQQFRDKLWGLHWNGFLKIDDGGPYSFNLLVNTTAKGTTGHFINCQSWLKIQDRVIASHDLISFFDGNQNAYGDIELRPGIYDFEVWHACNEIGWNTSVETSNPSITVNMRGPNDAMLRPIPRNQLLHEI